MDLLGRMMSPPYENIPVSFECVSPTHDDAAILAKEATDEGDRVYADKILPPAPTLERLLEDGGRVLVGYAAGEPLACGAVRFLDPQTAEIKIRESDSAQLAGRESCCIRAERVSAHLGRFWSRVGRHCSSSRDGGATAPCSLERDLGAVLASAYLILNAFFAGVVSLPTGSKARTSKVYLRGFRCLYFFGDLQSLNFGFACLFLIKAH